MSSKGPIQRPGSNSGSSKAPTTPSSSTTKATSPTATAASPTEDQPPTNETFSEPHVQHNLKTITFIRSCVPFVSGSVAGILGLTGWWGFICYGIFSIFCSVLLEMKCYFHSVAYAKTKAGKYKAWKGFKSSNVVWMEQVLGNMLSFVLFWTLSYGIVHIYD